MEVIGSVLLTGIEWGCRRGCGWDEVSSNGKNGVVTDTKIP